MEEIALYYVYILKCADGTLYTGYTNDLSARLAMHNSGRGAKYTRSRLPVEMVYAEGCANQSQAMRREIAIKKLTRKKKEMLINGCAIQRMPSPLRCNSSSETCNSHSSR